MQANPLPAILAFQLLQLGFFDNGSEPYVEVSVRQDPSRGSRKAQECLCYLCGERTSISIRDLSSLKGAFPSGDPALAMEELGMGFCRSLGHV